MWRRNRAVFTGFSGGVGGLKSGYMYIFKCFDDFCFIGFSLSSLWRLLDRLYEDVFFSPVEIKQESVESKLGFGEGVLELFME